MSISKRFQSALDRDDDGRPAGILCVERSHGRCLQVFNDDGFDREMEEFDTRAFGEGGDLGSQRDVFEFVTDFTLDTSGRLVIPARFRELVGLTDEAVAVGVNSRLEIWSRAHWEARSRGAESPLAGKVDAGSHSTNTSEPGSDASIEGGA